MKHDVLVSIDGQTIKTVADATLVLSNKKPGEIVRVEVRRKRRLRPAALRNFNVKLAPSP